MAKKNPDLVIERNPSRDLDSVSLSKPKGKKKKMAKRFYDTGLVDQEWYMSLKPKHKALYMHLLCKCDVAGVFEVNYRIMSAYVNDEIGEDDVFGAFGNRIVPLVKSESKGIIVDFVHFQCGGCVNPKVKAHMAIIKRMNELGISKDEMVKWCNHDLKFMDDEPAKASIEIAKSISVPPKTKDTNQMSQKISNMFSVFWATYPRREAKKVAELKFISVMKDCGTSDKMDATLKRMLDVVRASKNTEQWTKDGGKFIPMPSTWLNQRRWEDEGVVDPDGSSAAYGAASTIAKAIRI